MFFIGLLYCNIVNAQVKANPEDNSSYIKEAISLFDNNNWEEGRKVVEKGLDKYPNEPDLRMLLGKYYLHLDNYDKARYELVKSLNDNPEHIATKQMLINVETTSGRYSSAICYVNELLEVQPYDRNLWIQKINLYKLQGNVAEASRLRKRISHIYPDDSRLRAEYIYNTEMEAAEKRSGGNLDGSILLNKELISLQPNNEEYYMNLITDYLKIGDQYAAHTYLDRSINRFPGNMKFIKKKASLLAEQKRYSELLPFLNEQMKTYGPASLRKEYDNYLEEAASHTKNSEPIALYRKLFDRNNGNKEAFSYVFNQAISDQQYEEALIILNRHRKAKGDSKDLSAKELLLYSRMGNSSKVTALTKKLFAQYPDDSDLKDAYANTMFNEAKEKMAEGRYNDALDYWNMVKYYGDEDMYKIAQHSLYNTYMAIGDYNSAIDILTQVEESGAAELSLYIKKAEAYFKQQHYSMAVNAYEKAIDMAPTNYKSGYINGYNEMLTSIVTELNKLYLFDESKQYVDHWLRYDPDNNTALHYAVNLSSSTRDIESMKMFAQRGKTAHPEDVYFKIKLAEINNQMGGNYDEIYSSLYAELQKNPYHQDLINAFAEVAENLGRQLIKERNGDKAISVLNTALYYAPENKSLKYTKGLAFESIHKPDSAYYYQSFYVAPSAESTKFKHHLNYLKHKGSRNGIGLSYLHSKHGDKNQTYTISGIEYVRIHKSNTFTGRIYYSGREEGRGILTQGEWIKNWTTYTYTRIDAAWGNRFFPKWAFNASLYNFFDFLQGIETELGGGYKRLQEKKNLYNAVIGITKEIEPWRINVRFNNYKLDDEWLYNVSTNMRYYLSSPKNYIMAMASIGSSPDVELLNYQLYNGFSVVNTMVGAGIGHLLTESVSASILGTWNNFRINEIKFGNLYNIHLNLYVTF